jgi:hypothetical protein
MLGYMSSRQSRRDDALVISALMAILVGIGLLLHTTGIAHGLHPLWPLIILAAGAVLISVDLMRRSSPVFLSGGLFFLFAGGILLAGSLAGWHFKMLWPLLMAAVGLDWLAVGLSHFRRLRASFSVPALGFLCLGLFFSLFSFRIITISLGHFIAEWWPSLLIAGGVVLLLVYGASRPRPGRQRPSGRS